MWRRLFSKTYRVKCGDGTTRRVYHDVQDAVPIFLAETQSSGGVSLAEAAEIGVTGLNVTGHKAAKVGHVLFKLDEMNNNLVLDFRLAYALYQAEPCSQIATFKDQVEKLQMRQYALRELKMKCQALIELAKSDIDEGGFLALFREIALHGSSAAAVAELDSTRTMAANAWSGVNHG